MVTATLKSIAYIYGEYWQMPGIRTGGFQKGYSYFFTPLNNEKFVGGVSVIAIGH